MRSRHSISAYLHYCYRRIGIRSCRQAIWQVKAGHTNAIVGHPIIDVEAIGYTQIVVQANAGGEHDIGNNSDSTEANGASCREEATPGLHSERKWR